MGVCTKYCLSVSIIRAHICGCQYVPASEAPRGGHQVLCSSIPELTPLRQCFFLDLKLGWWPVSLRNVPMPISLLHTEISEAIFINLSGVFVVGSGFELQSSLLCIRHA